MTLRQPDDSREKFERAFVAISYVLGRRGHELGQPLGAISLAIRELIGGLSVAKQQTRAAVLAAEVGRIAQALESRRTV